MTERNVLGTELEPCGTDPITGFHRDGSCLCGPEDVGLHAVCAVVTQEFLAPPGLGGQRPRHAPTRVGVPRAAAGRPVVRGGGRWLQAHEAGAAAPVVLAATNARALEIVPIELLRAHAVDVPADPGSLI